MELRLNEAQIDSEKLENFYKYSLLRGAIKNHITIQQIKYECKCFKFRFILRKKHVIEKIK